MARLLIKNIGALVSGDISNPILNADAVLVEGGVIQAIGEEKELDIKGIDQMMDIGGMTLTPGLIDSHCHPVLGDFRRSHPGRGGCPGWISFGIFPLRSRRTESKGPCSTEPCAGFYA
jgi:enamidase